MEINENCLEICISDNDGVFIYDLDKDYKDSDIINYRSTIFNGTFKEFKEKDFSNIEKRVGFHVMDETGVKLKVKLNMKNNKFYLIKQERIRNSLISLKEL